MKFADKLQDLRKSKGLSQEDLAEKCNVSRQSVSKWETGQGYPETEKLLTLCELLGVDLDYLLRNKTKESSIKSEQQEISPYTQYVGKWVKVFLKDKEFNGFYCIAIIAIKNSYMLFMDDKGKQGLFDMTTITSISGYNDHKHKKQLEKLPSIPRLELNGDLLNYFMEKLCDVKLKQAQPFLSFTKPGGFYAVSLIHISDNGMTVLDTKGEQYTIKISDILFIKEH